MGKHFCGNGPTLFLFFRADQNRPCESLWRMSILDANPATLRNSQLMPVFTTTMARLHHEALQRWLTLPCRVNCVPTKFQCTEKKSCKRSYYRLQHRPRSPKGRLPANPEANLLPIVLPYQWMLATCICALPPLLSGKALTKRSAMSQIRVEGGPPSAFCSVKTGN